MKGDQRGCSSEWHEPEGHGLKNVHFCEKNKWNLYLSNEKIGHRGRQVTIIKEG